MEKTKVTLGEWFMDDNGNELSSIDTPALF